MVKLNQALLARHVWAHKRDNMLYFAPPLVVDTADIEEALGRVGSALDEVFR